MSQARTYQVAGKPPPPPREKPVPTKTQILTVLDGSRSPVNSKAEIMLACARLFGIQEPGMTSEKGRSWARSVIDYNATERLVDRMIKDGQIVGKEAWQWREEGLAVAGLQTGATYYATARRALSVAEKQEHVTDEQTWAEAGELAALQLQQIHREQYERLRGEAYDKLKRGTL